MTDYFGVSKDTDIESVMSIQGFSVAKVAHIAQSLAPSSVAADTSAEQTFTVAGLLTTDVVSVSGPSTAGIGIAGARVSAANTLAITFTNSTAAAVVPTAGTYQIGLIR